MPKLKRYVVNHRDNMDLTLAQKVDAVLQDEERTAANRRANKRTARGLRVRVRSQSTGNSTNEPPTSGDNEQRPSKRRAAAVGDVAG